LTKKSQDCSTLLIWDAEGPAPVEADVTVLWNSFGVGDKPGVLSLPRMVEERADDLRKRFLAFIFDLGETRLNGKRLVDDLELRPGFSYWWMTSIAYKANAFSSPFISDVVKLLALEGIISSRPVNGVTLVSSNGNLSRILMSFCRDAGLSFEWRRSARLDTPGSWAQRLYRLLPYPVQSVAWLGRYLWKSWPLKGSRLPDRQGTAAEITFVDYLLNLDRNELAKGKFASDYWANLAGILERAGWKVNWLHHYIRHDLVASASKARDLIGQFNLNGAGRQFHGFLDGTLSVSAVLAALRDYVRIAWRYRRLSKVKAHFRLSGSHINLWPLFRHDWRHSMAGPAALSNCLYLNLFERALSRLPYQRLGIYLQENQGWEMAFIHAWRAAGHGQLIGMPQATVRYWDLRYFFDPRCYQRLGKNDLPMPDRVALSGPAFVKAFQDGGYPVNQVVEVEALRYLYLSDVKAGSAGDESPAALHILVLGGYVPSKTKDQMECLVEAAKHLPSTTKYTIKPHPACPIDANDYPTLNAQVTNTPLLQLLGACDIAYTGNVTSSAVDAYTAGVTVVSTLDADALNVSPLRGLKGALYVTNPIELANALRSVGKRQDAVAQPYFFLDKTLPRWHMLLGLDSGTGKYAVGA